MAPLAEQDKITSLLSSAKNLGILTELAKDTRDAVIGYQVCTHTSSA